MFKNIQVILFKYFSIMYVFWISILLEYSKSKNVPITQRLLWPNILSIHLLLNKIKPVGVCK